MQLPPYYYIRLRTLRKTRVRLSVTSYTNHIQTKLIGSGVGNIQKHAYTMGRIHHCFAVPHIQTNPNENDMRDVRKCKIGVLINKARTPPAVMLRRESF